MKSSRLTAPEHGDRVLLACYPGKLIPGLVGIEAFKRAVIESGYQILELEETDEKEADQEERKMREMGLISPSNQSDPKAQIVAKTPF